MKKVLLLIERTINKNNHFTRMEFKQCILLLQRQTLISY